MTENVKTASFSDAEGQARKPIITVGEARKPIITVGEARKILGKSYNKITDDELRRVIIGMGDLARLIIANPQLFKFNDEEKLYE